MVQYTGECTVVWFGYLLVNPPGSLQLSLKHTLVKLVDVGLALDCTVLSRWSTVAFYLRQSNG